MSVQAAQQPAARRVTNGSGARLPEDPLASAGTLANRWIAVRLALKEAQDLGLKVRVAGADVVFDGDGVLPKSLRDHLYCERRLIWCYLGAEDVDLAALEFADMLGVDVELVQTVSEARCAVRQLIHDIWLSDHGHIAIDIETAPRPGYGEPRSWARLKLDGGVAAIQPRMNDRTGLDPHQSDIQTLQLYAGGQRCFVFRHAARDLVLHSHWLRRQRLVAHNAGFELAFIRNRTQSYRPASARRSKFRLDCTMEATGLMLGVEFGGGRSLANAAKQLLSVERICRPPTGRHQNYRLDRSPMRPLTRFWRGACGRC